MTMMVVTTNNGFVGWSPTTAATRTVTQDEKMRLSPLAESEHCCSIFAARVIGYVTVAATMAAA